MIGIYENGVHKLWPVLIGMLIGLDIILFNIYLIKRKKENEQ